MSFDAHQLDTFLLLGSLVTLLAILAVRVSSRVGLPSLLIYLLMGVLLGEGGPRHRLRRRPDGARARVRRAGADPGRRWSHHQLGRDPARDADGRLAGHRRRRGQRRGDGRRRRTTCSGCPGSWRSCSARSARRPTPRRCSRCCAWCRCRAGSPAPSRPSPASTTPRRSCWSRWSPPARRPTTACSRCIGHHRLRAGRRRAARAGRRLRRRLGDAAGGAPVLRPLPDRGAVA